MTTKNEWYDIAQQFKRIGEICDDIVKDSKLHPEIRTAAMAASTDLLKLAVIIKSHCLKSEALTCSPHILEKIHDAIIVRNDDHG
jgi:hypothetical protein